jgi:hypothetical protein
MWGGRRPSVATHALDREVCSAMASDASQDKAPLALPAHRNNWFVVERPTDGGTVFVKPPVPGSDSESIAADEPTS